MSASSPDVVWALAAIAERIGARLRGDPEVKVLGINTLQHATSGDLSFLANPVYRKYLATTEAGAVILSEADADRYRGNALIMDNPYVGYARASGLFAPLSADTAMVHPSAVIAPDVQLAQDVAIGPHVVIESGVAIGPGCQIGAGCVIGRDSQLGARVKLYPNATLYHGVSVGDECIFHSGVVVGGDGFGFASDGQQWVKIHQLAGVIIGCRVELGAGTCIDRGALGNTEIGDGVKIDNLVQVGHNCKIGTNTVISGCTAIAGSVEIGANCTIGGGVGIVGHLTIADGVMITAMTLVTGSISKAGSYSSGTTSIETSHWRKSAVRFRQLESLNQRVKRLEKNTFGKPDLEL